MPLFDLSPVADNQRHPDWAASSHHRACYVAANDERQARIYAADAFLAVETPYSDSGPMPASPWTCRAKVVAHPLFWRGVGAMAAGTIFVPADPDELHGDVLVLRRLK